MELSRLSNTRWCGLHPFGVSNSNLTQHQSKACRHIISYDNKQAVAEGEEMNLEIVNELRYKQRCVTRDSDSSPHFVGLRLELGPEG
jgi:hypothetical protein